MKKYILFAILVLGLNFASQAQQDTVIVKNKFEIGLNYALQRPIYSVTNILDVIAFSHDSRYRSKIGALGRYYIFERWFAEYSISFSQEGGGYKNQFTNTNYLKNSIALGFSTKHSRRIIWDIYLGCDLNLLINSRFVNRETGFSENVTDYNNRFVFGFPVIGTGLKTKISDNTYLALRSYCSFTGFYVSALDDTNVSQVIFPSVQISLTKLF